MRKLIITEFDIQRVEAIIASRRHKGLQSTDLDAVEEELARAEIVETSNVPNDVVTMNSTVVLRDTKTDRMVEYTLVFPWDADIGQDKISIFAPIGTALLGYQIGDIVHWEVPAGKRSYKIERVLFQPEREGRFDL
jgi:regulator of nucleoside diphosphate kinase